MDSSSTSKTIVTPSQVRAARAILGWSREDAAQRCGVSTASFSRFERHDGTLSDRTIQDIVRAFQQHGVDFFAEGRRIGVSLTVD